MICWVGQEIGMVDVMSVVWVRQMYFEFIKEVTNIFIYLACKVLSNGRRLSIALNNPSQWYELEYRRFDKED